MTRTENKITRWLKDGYPYLNEQAGLPSWLLPLRSYNLTADEMGDKDILNLSRPLKLADNIETVYDRLPDTSVFTEEDWQQAVSQWPNISQVKEVVEAYVEVADRITGQLNQQRDRIDPAVISRSLTVLLLAPLVPQGKQVTNELASILGSQPDQPGQLIRNYAAAVIKGDGDTIDKINNCITKFPRWVKWAQALEDHIFTMKFQPRLIAVTPPLSSELLSVLKSMMEEEQPDEP